MTGFSVAQHDQITELNEALLEALSKIPDEPGRLRLLAQNDLCSPAGARQLIEAARTSLRIDPRRSLALAEAATTIARSTNNEQILGPSLRAKANALHVLGENQSALDFHAKALTLFRKQGNKEEEARTLNASIQPCILLGNYERALSAATAAREVFRELGDHRRLAYVELNVGNLYHRQDRFEEALASYERAYDMFFPFADSEGLGVTLYNISVCLISLNDFPRALASYRRARGMFATHGMSLLVGQADYNIAYLYYLRGEYGRAITVLSKARAQSEASGDAHIQALCHLDLADIYLELNLSAQASESAREGLQRFRKLGMGYEEAKCLANEAIAWSQQNKPLRALELFAEARTIFVRENNLVFPSLIDLYCALAYFAEGRLFEARKSCQKALEFFDASTSPGKAALCRLLLARIELQNGNPAGALKHASDAIARLANREMPVLEYQAHYFRGRAHALAGNEDEAYTAYQTARAALETLRFKIRKEELKVPFLKEKTAVYEQLIQICLNREPGAGSTRSGLYLQPGQDWSPPENDDSSLREAFDYIELMKDRSLGELVLDELQETPKGIVGHSDMVRRIRDLREELNWYHHRIEIAELKADQSDTPKVQRLEAEARAREKNLIQILQELPESSPEARLFRPSEIVPLEKIQAELSPRVSLIEYFPIGEQLLAAIVTRERMQIVPVTLLPRLAELVAKFRAHLSGFRTQSKASIETHQGNLPAMQNILQSLYSELFEPLDVQIAEEHVVFIPHGLLHCIPFHALFDGQKYLIDRFAVSYAPSASSLAHGRNDPSPASDSRLLLSLTSEETPTNQRLIQAIASAMGGAQLLFSWADLAKTLQDAGSSPRWLHIANSDAGEETLAARTRFGSAYLGLANLDHLGLNPELVSLSGFAPRPGMDAAAVAEDLIALQKSVLENGAQSLISALWEVPESTVVEFFESLSSQCHTWQSEISKARIFQTVLQAVRQIQPHPFHWASFFLAEIALKN